MKHCSFITQLISILVLVSTCGHQNTTITKNDIKIIHLKDHPILVDHEKAIVVEQKGKRIDQIKGYTDTGVGCDAYLFEEKTQFIVIECNGTIYSINKTGGKIKNEEWSWMNPLPKNYVGTFIHQRGSNEYTLIHKPPQSLEEVYQVKYPND